MITVDLQDWLSVICVMLLAFVLVCAFFDIFRKKRRR
jgi:hypothetical protein